MLPEPLEILAGIRGIDANKKVIRPALVKYHVIDDPTLIIQKQIILSLGYLHARDIVGRKPLAHRFRSGAADGNLAHMADIEKSGPAAHRQMFGDDTAVLDGHFPTGKVNHAPAGAAMS